LPAERCAMYLSRAMFFFSSRRRHTRCYRDWSSDVCSSDLIGAAYGAAIVRAARPVHGKASRIHHDGRGIFTGLPNPFQAARYHSLAIARNGVPPALGITATADDGEIMAVAHVQHPVIGLQFHPESVLTEYGYRLLDRFLHGAAAPAHPLPRRADWADGGGPRPPGAPLELAPPPAAL